MPSSGRAAVPPSSPSPDVRLTAPGCTEPLVRSKKGSTHEAGKTMSKGGGRGPEAIAQLTLQKVTSFIMMQVPATIARCMQILFGRHDMRAAYTPDLHVCTNTQSTTRIQTVVHTIMHMSTHTHTGRKSMKAHVRCAACTSRTHTPEGVRMTDHQKGKHAGRHTDTTQTRHNHAQRHMRAT